MINQMTHADIAFSFDGAWPISTVTPLSALYGFNSPDKAPVLAEPSASCAPASPTSSPTTVPLPKT
jgi:hypothetical protein